MTTAVPHPYGLSDAEAFLAGMERLDRAREAVFVIEHRHDGAIGVLGFQPSRGLGPEIGYWIGKPYWGQGLASEATAAALTWAGRDWGKRVVVSGHFADNPASGRVLEKAGFLYTGEIEPRHSKARGALAPTRMMVWLAWPSASTPPPSSSTTAP